MNKKGFTLIELLAVIIILGILMLIAIPSVTNYINNSRQIPQQYNPQNYNNNQEIPQQYNPQNYNNYNQEIPQQYNPQNYTFVL